MVRWLLHNADVFQMVSFQPMAQVGRTEAGLGGGVSVEAPNIAASQVVVPVLFSAKPDATVAGALATVTGQPETDDAR